MEKGTQAFKTNQLIAEIRRHLHVDGKSVKGICVDFFDTLVSRTVAPEFTKRIAARQILNACNVNLSTDSLYEIRRELEKSLCEKRAGLGHDPEFNLQNLAVELYPVMKTLSPDNPILATQAKFRDAMIEVEIATEMQVQRVDEELVDFLWTLKSENYSICLISDFYLPAEPYTKILEYHNLESLFTALYISSDHHLTKSSGRLYDLVQQEMSWKHDEMIMIGDNAHSDYYVPQKKGITAFLIDSKDNQVRYLEHEQQNRDQALRNSCFLAKVDARLKAHSQVYFNEMAVTFWLFIKKLHQQVVKDGITNLFFCSKEGEFLKTLFEEYQQLLFGKQLIKTHYLLVSRKATFICSLKSLEEERFERLFEQYRDLSLEEFLLSLNFTDAQVAEICAVAELDAKGRRTNLREHPDFSSLLESPKFQDLYEKHRQSQRTGFSEYLDSFGVDYRDEGMVLVDVGWKGSIQNNIFHALGGDVEVKGFYIGLLTPSGLHETNKKQGLIFTDHPSHSPYVHVYNNNRSLFEMLLGASHGSANGYSSKIDAQVAAVQPPKRREASTAHGEVPPGVYTLDLPEERKLYNERIFPLQQEYRKLVGDITRAFQLTDAELPDKEWFARLHARMVFQPRQEEVEFFATLYHLENFGLFEFTEFDSRKNISLGERLQNFRKLLGDPAAYLETGVWPPIILRRLGLEFLQPVDGWKRSKRMFREEK